MEVTIDGRKVTLDAPVTALEAARQAGIHIPTLCWHPRVSVLVACRLCHAAKGYLFFSHLSAEAGHRPFFEMMETWPLLDLGMRLGEGTGAALAMSLIEAGVKIYNEMATFESAGVSNTRS